VAAPGFGHEPAMFAALWVVAPIFGLILACAAARRSGIFGPEASPQLNRFVVWLALPALLFDVTAHATWRELDQPGFVAGFGLACLALFGATIAVARFARGDHLADASVDGLAAAYSNTGYLGFPLALVALGRGSLTAVTIATLFTVCVLFALAIVLVEVGLQAERHAGRMAGKVAVQLLRNPLFLSPVLGAAFAATGLPLPQPAQGFLTLLGGAASPCALVGLGLFIAEKRPAAAGGWTRPALLALAKLLVQPLLTWWLVARVFATPPSMAQAAVLMAALPTGTGPFMLAEFYGREALATSRAILLSTIGSVATLSVLVYLFQAHR
jgi:predicted permease